MPLRSASRAAATDWRSLALGRWDVGLRHVRWHQRLSSQQLFVLSFATLIAVGTTGLRLCPLFYAGAPLSWLDSLFTITSAVCVTGLTVVDTATYFTFWGQAWILLFIQLGGLGIIAFSSLLIIAMGRRLSLQTEEIVAVDISPHLSKTHLVRDVILFTFLFEAVGAACLYLLWQRQLGAIPALWPALFQSVSAFCNAGFSTFSDNLAGYQRSPLTLLVIGGLIVAGGLGFLTLEDIYVWCRTRGHVRRSRLSLHSRIVLWATAGLIVVGAGLYLGFEYERTLHQMPLVDKISNALFMSVTCRTAGFNTIDYASASDSSNFLTILLMTVGGSPGSTAGGIKTTTFALLLLLALARFRGSGYISLAGRSVREETIQRAAGLTVLALTVVTVGVFVMTATERGQHAPGDFLRHAFECASAFNTVGLSMGITPTLTGWGRVVAIALMFVGRVGPITVALALAKRLRHDGDFHFAYEEVVIG